MNPFVSTIEKGDLFNIANGKAALGEMAKFLPNVWTTGFSAHDCFIKDCNDDPNACQNTIRRQKIKNSSSEAGSYKMLNKVETLDSVLMTRDLFGSILYHASQAQVDMEQILRDPLTLVPLPISDVGWTMQKTRTWKKSCIKFTYKCWSNHDWWYIIFSLRVPIPIYPCCRVFVETSFQTKRDGNSLGFWQNGLTLYKGCWKNQEIKPARYGLLDNWTWTKTSIKLASSGQRRSTQNSSCHIFSRLFGERQFYRNLVFKEANCQ